MPEHFKGKQTLLLIGYVQDSQFDIDRWLIGLDMTKTKVDVYELPTIAGMAPRMFQTFIDNGMRRGIPKELWDAAQIDGAGHFRFLTAIVIPMSRPVIWTVTLFTFIDAWNEFIWPLLVTTTSTWRPLGVGLWTFVSEAGPETQLMMAGSVIATVPIMVLFLGLERFMTKGLTAGSVKG